MFTRTSSVEPTAFELTRTNRNRPDVAPSRTGPSGGKSVIGNDLKILGQGLKIISQGVLQVDGKIGGDVRAAEVIVGEQGMVTGIVAGTQVVVHGKVAGVICGKTVGLHASSHVEGDIHHMSFSIEQGAIFEGRSRRVGSDAELDALMDERTGADSL
jgi:cytoskeletal protein CcmA (bactofilin family)